jgi:hypothetical protein
MDGLDLGPFAEGWRLAVGELDERTQILDTSMLLSADGDAIVSVSAELATIVVGCGAETTSGTYWLFAAEQGRLLRAYWACHTDMRRPWSTGDPLPSEARHPLEDLDGHGLIAVLAGFGFDHERWSARDDLRELVFEPTDLPAADGPLSMELDAFRRSVAIPEGQRPSPVVVARDGGYDLTTVAPKEKKRGILGFLRR